jgi:hypothetical protein
MDFIWCLSFVFVVWRKVAAAVVSKPAPRGGDFQCDAGASLAMALSAALRPKV